MILDEPTNHLDIPAREALEDALQEYDGSIITVSHDRFFLDKIATQILSFDDDSTVDVYHGNYTQYHDWKAGTRTSMSAAAAGSPESSASNEVKGARAADQGRAAGSSLSKNQRTQIENRIKKVELEISKLEDLAAKLSAEMSEPEIAGDFDGLSEITSRHLVTESSIRNLYEEWDRLTSQLEG